MKDILEVLKEGSELGFQSAAGRASAIQNFEEKYDAFVGLITNREGHNSNKREFLMKEAETTSDFSTLFGTVLQRTLRAKYDLNIPEYRQYIKVGTQNDFRNAWDMATYGNRAVLDVVKERGEYKEAKLADGKFVINVKKYGRAFGLSWETIINDDLGAFADTANDLVLSARNTESYQVTQLFSGSGGPNSTLYSTSYTHPIDGATGLVNKKTGATGLNATELASAITALKSQKDFDGNPIMFKRFVLVVPVALEFTALQVLSKEALIATALSGSSATSTVIGTTGENIIAKYPISLVVNPWLDIIDTTAGLKTWYLFGAPEDGDAVKFNFLRGHEAPEICQKMSDKITLGGAPISPLEGDFDSDAIRWRIRHVMGGVQTDPRYTYAVVNT